MKKILATLLVFLFCHSASAAVYLDNNATTCSDGATDYDPVSRSCGSGSDTIYDNLASFSAGIEAGATNYMRAGEYWRDSGVSSTGSLHIDPTKSGTSESPTILQAYSGEARQVVIGTDTRKATYNTNPTDGASCSYYPNTVIAFSGPNYIILDGIKTYGQMYTWGGHDVTVRNCDLGGGGPSENQGQVLKLHSGYNINVYNNYIHRSVRAGDAGLNNSAAVILYDASANIHQNTFEDNVANSVCVKDTGYQTGRSINIYRNEFRDSSIYEGVAGVLGHNQDWEDYDYLNVYQNVFFTPTGYGNVLSPRVKIYNNTFVGSITAISLYPWGEQNNATSEVYNNIIVPKNSTSNFIGSYGLNSTIVTCDYNVLVGDGRWDDTRAGEYYFATTLADWRTVSGHDTHSVTSDPQFVNASGNIPEDFKRVAYAENLVGSPYGTKAGAYITGEEQIGVDWLYADDGGGTDPVDPETPTTSGPILRTGPHLLRVGDSVLRVQ